METGDFLRRVLPANGGVYFAASATDTGLKQQKLNSIDAIVKYVERERKGHDVYYATGTYKTKRVAAECTFKRSIYVDLDCGPKKPYASKRDALTSLLTFCKNHFVLPSIIVDSGGGVHAYWTFVTEVPTQRWAALAGALKTRCLEENLQIDPTVTSDAARILRVPNTINYKHGMPQTTKVFHESEKDYPIEDLEQKLSVARRASLSLVVDNDDLSGGMAKAKEYSAELIIARCPMYKDAMETGGKGLPEQLWMQQLHVLAYCKDGEEFAFKISEGYEGYAETETRMKWNRQLANKESSGPTRCSTFSSLASQCQTCPYNGNITTPLQLGLPRDVTLPFPYEQDAQGVYFMTQTNNEPERVDVIRYQVQNFSVFHAEEGVLARFTAVGKGTTHNVEVNYADVLDRKQCCTALSRHHIVLAYEEYPLFREFMSSWIKRMQDAKSVRNSWSHLGWAEGMFVTGASVYGQSGFTQANLGADRHLNDMYKAKGEKDVWLTAAHIVTGQGRHAADAIIATAFGGVLMPFLRDSSAVMSFVSRSSGSGKSTAMELAQAVWGNPKTAMNQLDDTVASVFRKIAYAHNLPVYWDELRMKDDAQRFTQMVFQLTGGKERSRLTSSADLRSAGTWQTILTVASNESIASHTDTVSKDSEAGRARVFEVTVPELTEDELNPELNKLLVNLQNNFGVVGEEYAAFLAANRDVVKNLVTAVHDRLCSRLKKHNVERFWLSSMAALLAGAMLAKKLGYIKTDLKAFEAWLDAQFHVQQQERQEQHGSGTESLLDIVMEYVAGNRDQLVVCENLPMERTRTEMGRVLNEPLRGSIWGAFGINDSLLRVPMSVFNMWLAQHGYSNPRAMKDALGIRPGRERVSPVREGTPAPLLKIYDIPLPSGAIRAHVPDVFEEED